MSRRSPGAFRTGGHRHAAGVSLLEMLLVVGLMAIAGLLAAMVLTGGFDGMRLRSEARELAAQLRYTRAQAIATGRPQRFVIDPRSHRWQAPDNRRGTIPASLGVSFTGARQAQARAGEGGILFFHDGGSTGGRVRLQARRAAWVIDVGWLTGEVKLSRASVDDGA
ncbi:type II secretion system protein XpsH [Pseudoxanthomonas wuyuanensis]|uniref:Type II secretion system protein H n=1 Tax=Pseudoxanthomonas wuyuanensis TaxID=1073196 RepID=A0A286DC45_9GAMM|nr:GspH/FimT family pseudopilin [Pseudoxanthomonas wuyuanensis]KAF1717277.1 type II secretion system protein GspH [Pseudoxanthomonas wuyuanensis]SOD56235.1 type II secretion system protein H (GspH) [Pseudoxanthomonas wuyuanensis]